MPRYLALTDPIPRFFLFPVLIPRCHTRKISMQADPTTWTEFQSLEKWFYDRESWKKKSNVQISVPGYCRQTHLIWRAEFTRLCCFPSHPNWPNAIHAHVNIFIVCRIHTGGLPVLGSSLAAILHTHTACDFGSLFGPIYSNGRAICLCTGQKINNKKTNNNNTKNVSNNVVLNRRKQLVQGQLNA